MDAPVHRSARPVDRLQPGDAGEVLTLQRAAYVTEAQAHDDFWLPPLTQTLDDLSIELARPTVLGLGVRDGGRLVAAVRVEIDDAIARLGRLVVAPDRQGQGLGTTLLSEVELALETDAEVGVIELFTGERSAANLRLYRRLGYRETSRSPAGTYDVVHLRKNLRAPRWTMRRADGVSDLGTVVDLLDERARWLHERGITGQWPLPFPDSVVRAALDAGHTWLAEIDGEPAATITLTWTDTIWADAVGAAGYVHRLAVRPGHPGFGAELLAWAAGQVRARGRRFLRLDCAASNSALCAYYDTAGFRRRGTRTVRGFPGDTRPDSPAVLLQRYELDLELDMSSLTTSATADGRGPGEGSSASHAGATRSS